jgi:hypothetical protein
MKDINKDADLQIAINHIDEAVRILFAIHDNETLAVMSDLADCIWKLREIRNHS